MANPTLRYASKGNDVVRLQQGMNLLPSAQPRLTADGVYGTKTTARVREFQSANSLTPDGVVGPLTWDLLLQLLAQLPAGIPPGTLPFDALRPFVLTIAQKHIGSVDFLKLVNGRPRGIDFLIEMFRVAANTSITDAAFKLPNGAWVQEPLIGGQRKSWCGVFAVYCYRMAGIPVFWDMVTGRPVGPLALNRWRPTFAAGIKPADIGAVRSKSHHFLIETVGAGPVPRMTTIDGNQPAGRIDRIPSGSGEAHQVGVDNFNYYSLI
ncbi:MAG: peptidoglycan-binding protein [Rubrivivax sp.]|jgi:hypothetical protein|nr:peptidoglycan-binding protein [Betaproteobacteria bacterium]MBP6316522.1 peptidoglycan-binding protein [Rubrivivax sp.]MBK7458692.1 peptidoglycan-binding protein [Betaproteobacteria bacterium]MBK7517309.1 peptidoglycan-binding protein [Betaproteobacteria bacterium]MBK8107560.1 peptidoglycan-binding protein [Betaproteobacteria bacterium]